VLAGLIDDFWKVYPISAMLFAQKILAPEPQLQHPGNIKLG